MNLLPAVCLNSSGAGLTRLKMGDDIFSHPDFSRAKAYAGFVVINEATAALRSKSAPPIHATAGGSGRFASQLTEWNGAHVIGLVSAQKA